MAANAVRGGIERVYSGATVAGLTERELLDRFVQRRDPSAFEALVIRHGPMVLGVCRRLLRDPNDVDDAFQATFLVLVRKAETLRRRDLLGNWLYGVAFKVASRSRAVAAARSRAEGLESVPAPNEPEAVDEAVAEEVDRLPEKYRSAVVLCHLEGLTHEEAAQRLGWPVGTVKGRLSRARDLLRARLTRRGVTLAIAATAVEALASRSAATASVADRLISSAIKTATSAAEAGVVSARVLALTEGVIHAMTFTKLKTLAATLTLSGAIVSGTGALAYQGFGPPGTRGADAPPRADHTIAKAIASAPRSDAAPDVSASETQPAEGVGESMEGGALTGESVRQLITRKSGELARAEVPTANRSIQSRLKEPIAFQFTNPTPLEDVLRNVKSATQTPNGPGIPIYVDPIGLQEAESTLTTPVTINIEGVPLRTALQVALSQIRLAYTVHDGLLVVTSPKGIGRFTRPSASLAVREKLERLASLNFPNETPLQDALEFIKKLTEDSSGKGIPIYVDPIGLQEAEQTLTSPIVIDLDDVPLRTSLRLLLRQLGLAHCVRDGVLIISSEERVLEEIDEALHEIEAARN